MQRLVLNLRSLLVASLLLTGSAVLAQPGTILELSGTGAYTPAQIDGLTAGRFRNNGGTPPGAAYTVDTYLLRYESTWPDGAPAEITAQLFVPRGLGDAVDLFAFAPGSTGLVEACAPSRPFVDRRAFGTYNAYTLAYAGQGYAALMPNYMGFFDVGTIQPYFHRVAEGRSVLDGLRAAEAALERLGVGADLRAGFVGGYSQGGHAAFAAADLHASYAPDARLDGVVGFGPTTDLEAVLFDFTYVAPWVIYSYDTFFPDRIDPTDVLREPYLSSLVADAERLCIGGAQSYYPSVPEGLFAIEFGRSLVNGTLAQTHPELAELFSENDAGVAGHGLPAVILQGEDDPVVDIEFQNAFVAELCERGSRVAYPNYVDTRHETRYIGFPDAIAWMQTVAAGEAAPSDCALVTNE
jgi:predicted esterase